MNYDIYMVGVGGQGLLTIGEILAEVAFKINIPVSFYPSKGMAQRGGFVKAQLRFGRQDAGPSISERSADMVMAAELSEALKAVRFIKLHGDFILSGETWMPTAVVLGKASYPRIDQIKEQISAAGARLHYLDPMNFPIYHGVPAPINLYMLGVAVSCPGLQKFIKPADVESVIKEKWRRNNEMNCFAFHCGLGEAEVGSEKEMM